MSSHNQSPDSISRLPHALDRFEQIVQEFGNQSPAVFLDYDGTLTEIAERPDLATLTEPVRKSIRRLAGLAVTGIISGRDLDDVQRLIQVGGIWYAGSHGFDLLIPGQGRLQPHPVPASLERVENDLRSQLEGIQGILLERKRYSLAVHYRQARHLDTPAVQAEVDKVLQGHPDLRQLGGKKVIEIQPSLEWDKGQAVLHILDLLPWPGKAFVPMYIGDDTTDEKAFAALASRGISICVGDLDQTTRARYRLQNPDEVHAFLHRLILWLEKAKE